MNCPICGTPITVKTEPEPANKGDNTKIIVACMRCDVRDVFFVERKEWLAGAITYAKERLVYQLEHQSDAQAKRLAAQMADLERVKASLTQRFIARVGSMSYHPHPLLRFHDPVHFICRMCRMVAEQADDIKHTTYNSVEEKYYTCPLGAVIVAIDYLRSIQEQVKGGQAYDVGHFIP